MKSKWVKGMQIVVGLSDCSNKVPQTLTYEEHNTLIDSMGRKVWFNEALRAEPYVGLVLCLDMSSQHICSWVEILEVIERSDGNE